MNIEKIKERILKLDKKNKVKFIVLFGSVIEKKNTPLSDIDLAVFYVGNKKERFRFRIKASGDLPDNVDIQIFQDLPLTVQNEVLTGKPVYYDDYQFIFDDFDEYMKVIKEFSSFEKYYKEYFKALEAEI